VIVIAQSRYIAEDAAALVSVDYDPLPVVADCKQGVARGAPTARRGKASNVILEIRQAYGDIDAASPTPAAHRLI